MVLPCSKSLAQGCGEQTLRYGYTCYSDVKGGKPISWEGSICVGGGDQVNFCSLSPLQCPNGYNSPADMTTASTNYDPEDCGGGSGGGSGGGCLLTGCTPTYTCTCDDSTCGCVYLFGDVKGQGIETKRGCGNRTPARARARPMVLSSSDYGGGELYDGLPLDSSQDGGTADLGGVPYLTGITLKEGNALGGRIMKMTPLLLASLCAAPILCAQQTASPVINLKTISVDVASARNLYTDPNDDPVCDLAGNVYVRVNRPEDKPGRQPIVKVTPQGKLGGIFPAPDSIAGAVRGVFVTPDGIVYRLVQGPKGAPPKYTDRGYYLLEFAQDGTIRAETKLELEPNVVDIWHLAAFKSGEFLVAGAIDHDPRDPFLYRTSFTAVFAHDGRLIKKIYEPEDEEARQRGAVDWVQGEVQDNNRNFVYAGGTAAGSDGNVYLLRGGYPSLVYVISPAGEVLRKLRVDAGNQGRIARGIKFYDGRLAIGFERAEDGGQELIKVTDLEGKAIADYSVGAGLEESTLACYGSEGFTMSSEGPNPLLLKAKP